ncbi:hypothetical protein Zmor_023709 [Zophobas morio]|uniref:Sodium channel protein Nach n=1 Tax=Zophobas morio TaxID=2755281 RepID=A0AA38M863_9CUCU|nr:hypothetical protein Zmor_023674 [Zophobas morio]KAJ3646102.1 hypothetical protein Zmor_023709 [Zophobas morio]
MKETAIDPNRNNDRRTVTNVQNYFKEYCNSTSIHGFRYFGENRSTFEKVWWIVIFILCLSGCSFMIYKIYEKYETSPVIVTFATKETPIHQIPFPAVTICPEIKFKKEKFNLTVVVKKKKEEQNITVSEEQIFQYASLLCKQSLQAFVNETAGQTLGNDFFTTLDEIKPEFIKSVIYCKFLGQDYSEDCSELLTPVFTDEGVCYSFNILDRSHIFNDLVYHYKDYHNVKEDTRSWNMEFGYAQDAKGDAYPKRALFSGANNGLTLYMGVENIDFDYMCNSIQGFKVVLHSPVRIPKLKQEYFRVPLNQEVVAAVHPIMIMTSPAVQGFNVEKRECYFPSEKKLKYFRSYSQQNCFLECLTNVTLNFCDCVNFYMPKENATKICGKESSTCVKVAETILQLGEEYSKFYQPKSDNEFETCDCLPICTDLSYDVQTSQTNWDWKESFAMVPGMEHFNKEKVHLSSLTVYFRFNHFITSERQELYGPTDFVANFGGLLGLFTGFSILSLMEIIYFLTLRICCNIRLYGQWAGVQ